MVMHRINAFRITGHLWGKSNGRRPVDFHWKRPVLGALMFSLLLAEQAVTHAVDPPCYASVMNFVLTSFIRQISLPFGWTPESRSMQAEVATVVTVNGVAFNSQHVRSFNAPTAACMQTSTIGTICESSSLYLH